MGTIGQPMKNLKLLEDGSKIERFERQQGGVDQESVHACTLCKVLQASVKDTNDISRSPSQTCVRIVPRAKSEGVQLLETDMINTTSLTFSMR
jgi:hypothetical protein